MSAPVATPKSLAAVPAAPAARDKPPKADKTPKTDKTEKKAKNATTAAPPSPPGLPAKAAKPGKTDKPGDASAAAGAAKATPAKPRSWPKGGPTKADLKRYRDALVARRRELVASSKDLASEALQAGGGDFSVDHMADHGSDNYEQDFSLKLLEGEAGQLAEIRDALAKIDGKGELPFGLCEGCADEPQGRCASCPWIPSSRLDAIPQARLCVQLKEREEARG